jgi:hypothetical protein
MKLIESLNRTVKLALDDGSAGSLEEALARFGGFHIQIIVGEEVTHNLALQAYLQTVLNAAPRTFRGEVTIAGNLDFVFGSGWHMGQTLLATAKSYGVYPEIVNSSKATLVVGPSSVEIKSFAFALYVQCTTNGFVLSPDPLELSAQDASGVVGVAAAGAALNECFQYLYFKKSWAGQRLIEYDFPVALTRGTVPDSLRVIGLGHLGQAAVWTLGFVQSWMRSVCRLVLQDYDLVSESGLSTGLLTDLSSVGQLKVDAVKGYIDRLMVDSSVIATRMELDSETFVSESVCLVAVDDFLFRKKLDSLRGTSLIEAGIGEGVLGFTKFQLHVFPGKRLASDVWTGSSEKSTKPIQISAPAYQKLLHESSDECGTTQLAGRSIATPFIGAFAGAHLVAYSLCHSSTEVDAIALDVNSLN